MATPQLTDRLKQETSTQHEFIETLPYFKALFEGTLALESYIAHLRALATIHGVLEDQIMQTNDPVLGTVWHDDMRKLPLLFQDLKDVDPGFSPDLPGSVEAALEITKRIRLRRINHPMSLVGYLYVLEGSTLGGSILRQQLASAFGFQHNRGLSYVGHYGKEKRVHWERFRERMNSTHLEAAEQQAVIEAAKELFKQLTLVFEALHPIQEKVPFYHVTSLNPEGGNHPIPKDAEEIKAALRAGQITWKQFPYYAWRYGERGQRYTRSDSAWLTTLVNYPIERIKNQIRWLGVVLSTRGMPQWMLEIHLENMYQELVEVHPEKETMYAKLKEAASDLKSIRRDILGDEVLDELSAEFEAMVGPEWSWRLKHMGKLLVMAVVDEKSGIDGAVTSIESWATNPYRFPEIFITAVQKTIREARQRLSQPG